MNGADVQKLEIYDIYDQMQHVPFWRTLFFKMMCGVLLALVVGVLIFFLIKKMRNKIVQKTVAERAAESLHELKKHLFATEKERKYGYFALTRIAKELLADRYKQDITALTDQELVAYLKRIQEHDVYERINAIVASSQEIKYAHADAAREQIMRDIDHVLWIVQQQDNHTVTRS